MRYSLIKYSLQVVIMFAVISKAFGLGKTPEDSPLMPRQINLSGNVVHFSIPENFSQDMPAEDMIESIDLADQSVYHDDQRFTLIRRWWDFKESGFFGKDYGTLMMSLYLKQASDSLSVNTLKPLDFIDIIIDDIEKNKSGDDDSLMVYSDYFTAYKEEWFSEQRWLMYIQGHANVAQHTMLYAIPVTENQYIVAEFTSAPSSGIGARGFIENYSGPFIENIMTSFHVEYTSDNPVKQAVLKTNTTLQQLIDEKVKLLEQKDKK